MRQPTHPAARRAGIQVYEHFARDLELARRLGHDEPLPDPATIEAMIDAAFWASLHRQEGYSPRISLAFVHPERSGRTLSFVKPLPLDPNTLTPLAAAVERPGIHLGVWPEDGELCVWGATRDIPPLCFVLEVVVPGLLVIKHRRGDESAKFVNVAVLEGDHVKVVDREAATLPGCPNVVMGLLGFDLPGGAGAANPLAQLAISMRDHGKGGTLLVVPAGGEEWRESLRHPLPYNVSPPFSSLADVMAQETRHHAESAWQEQFRRAVDSIAGLTAVDGATVMTDQYEVVAFGVKIRRREGYPTVESVMVSEPIEGSQAETLATVQLGGTRHTSAAQFAHDQRDAIAMVASQDGRFTIFAWSPCDEIVHARRVETLLL